jgi:hypothetical protein
MIYREKRHCYIGSLDLYIKEELDGFIKSGES